jgi:lambda repressor-like predicted transcriptional regulator
VGSTTRTAGRPQRAKQRSATPKPPQGRLAPRRFKPIPDDAPAKELGEYLRAMIRSREGLTLDKLAAAGGLAKTTLTTTMDGRSKEWAAVQRLIDAYLAVTGEADLTARTYDEIRRRYEIGRAAHAGRQKQEGKTVKPGTSVAPPEPLPPFYAAKVVQKTVKLPRRTPGASIDATSMKFLTEDEVSRRVAEIGQLRRLAERYKADVAALGRTRGRVAVTGRDGPGGRPMPRLCQLDAAEATALLSRGPWVSVHTDLYQGISFLFEGEGPPVQRPARGPGQAVSTIDRAAASQLPWTAPGWSRPPARAEPDAATRSPAGPARVRERASLWLQVYPLLLIAAGIAVLPVDGLWPLGVAAVLAAAGILLLRAHPATGPLDARQRASG